MMCSVQFMPNHLVSSVSTVRGRKIIHTLSPQTGNDVPYPRNPVGRWRDVRDRQEYQDRKHDLAHRRLNRLLLAKLRL